MQDIEVDIQEAVFVFSLTDYLLSYPNPIVVGSGVKPAATTVTQVSSQERIMALRAAMGGSE